MVKKNKVIKPSEVYNLDYEFSMLTKVIKPNGGQDPSYGFGRLTHQK